MAGVALTFPANKGIRGDETVIEASEWPGYPRALRGGLARVSLTNRQLLNPYRNGSYRTSNLCATEGQQKCLLLCLRSSVHLCPENDHTGPWRVASRPPQ